MNEGGMLRKQHRPMKTKARTLKAPVTTGKLSRAEIRGALFAVHVMPNPQNGWAVRRSAGRRLSQRFPSKADALKFARSIGKKVNADVIVHGRDGRIRHVDSYEADPQPPRERPRTSR